MDQTIALWTLGIVFSVLLAVISGLLGWAISATRRLFYERLGDLNRMTELAHTRINNTNGNMIQIEDKQNVINNEVTRHSERHKLIDATLERLEKKTEPIAEISEKVAVIHERLTEGRKTG